MGIPQYMGENPSHWTFLVCLIIVGSRKFRLHDWTIDSDHYSLSALILINKILLFKLFLLIIIHYRNSNRIASEGLIFTDSLKLTSVERTTVTKLKITETI